MKIWLVDKQKWYHLSYEEARRLLTSGLEPKEWTRANIQKYLLY